MSWLAIGQWLWRALRAIPPRVWALLAALLLAWWLIDGYGDRRAAEAEAAVQARWDAENAAELKAQAEANIAARKIEERHRAEYRAIAERFIAERKQADAKHAAAVAALHDGSLRVRGRLQCPADPGTPAGAAGTDGTGPGGLSPEDAEFLLRIGAEADAIARRLNALQEAVRAGER